MVWPKSPFGCSANIGVQILAVLAQKGDLILAAAAALDFTRIGQQQPRLADQIERDIGQAQILFERGRMSHPFAQPLPEHQAQVAEAQHVAEQRSARRPWATAALIGS